MKKVLVVILFLAIGLITKAQDRYFGRTYTTDILQKGAIDLEFWH